MKVLLKCILGAAFIICLGVLNLTIAYILPPPWDKMNIIFAASLLLIIFRGSGVSVWIVFFSYLIIELYTITPFGVTLLSGTWGALFTFWLFHHVFTNRSWYATLGLTVSSLILYRLTYIILLFATTGLSITHGVSVSLLVSIYGWEIFLTTLVVVIGYTIIAPFARSMDTRTLRW